MQETVQKSFTAVENNTAHLQLCNPVQANIVTSNKYAQSNWGQKNKQTHSHLKEFFGGRVSKHFPIYRSNKQHYPAF